MESAAVMSQKFIAAVETLEATKLKITITVTPEAFRESIVKAYNKNKHHFSIQGFRKGKAPRKLIEQAYGREVFFEDAINIVLPDAYEAALDEHNIEPVYRPEIEPGPASEKEGAVFYATVYIRPEVEVDGYLGLTYHKASADATEDEIQQALESERQKNSTQASVDRPAEMGDIVTINYKGYMDGELFEGGQATDHELTLGSRQFIDTFEEQLVGHIPGDDVTVNVNFPEEYHHADYSGKPATFEVEIIDVQAKILPELDDDFAANVSEFDTLVEYRAKLAEDIKESKAQNLDNMKRGHVMKQLADKTTLDVPEAMYLARQDEMLDEFKYQIQMQGMNFEMYTRFTQASPESLKASWRPQAESDVNNMLILEGVARKESISISDEEFLEHICKITNKSGDEATEIITNLPPFRRKEIERSVLCQKAMDFILENAVETDEPILELDASELESKSDKA